METEETICPKCHSEYSQKNPPRLLTMCGHTLCQKCITKLIPPKKLLNKYRIICPIDKISGELANPNAGMFPRNIAILNLVKKKNEIKKDKERISETKQAQSIDLVSNVGASNQTIQILPTFSPLVNSREKQEHSIVTEINSVQNLAFFNEGIHAQTCLLHQKPLDIICTRDCQRICASCVIFGEHRGHKVKNAKQVNEMQIKMKQQLQSILSKQNQFFTKFCNKETFKKISDSLSRKKIQFSKKIKKMYQQLNEMMINAEKQSIYQMQKKIEQVRNKLERSYEEKRNLRMGYAEWEDKITEKLNILKSGEEEEKALIIFKSGNFVQNCQNTLKNICLIQNQLFVESQQTLEGLSLVFDSREISNTLTEFCKIQEAENSFLQISLDKPKICAFYPEQSLLDDEPPTVLNLAKSMIVQKQCFKQTSFGGYKNNIQVHNRLDKVKSTHKDKGFLSPVHKPLRTSTIINVSSSKKLNFNKTTELRTKNIPQKYEKAVMSVLKNTSQVLDLTNAELGWEKICQILQFLESYPVKILKLGRNKMTDQGIAKLEPFLVNISMLNLTKNQLTDQSLFKIVKWRKEGKLPNLKSLNLGQNKIIQRKYRNLIDGLKFTGVNVCI